MQGLQAASQETCLPWSPIDQPGCAERAEFPSGDEEDGTGVPACIVATPCHRERRRPPPVRSSRSQPYGGFIMIRSCLRRAPLAALLLACSWRAACVESAADGGLGSDDLSAIVVVANRAPEPLSRVGNSVTVLTDADIRDSQFVMVSDLLAQTPGLSVAPRRRGPADLGLHSRRRERPDRRCSSTACRSTIPPSPGGGFDFGNLLTGGLGESRSCADAQSTLYGSQAMGGVISIMTAEPTGPLSGGFDGGGRLARHRLGHRHGGRQGRSLCRGDFRAAGTARAAFPASTSASAARALCASQIGGGSGQLRYELTPDARLRRARLLHPGAHRFRRLRHAALHLRRRQRVQQDRSALRLRRPHAALAGSHADQSRRLSVHRYRDRATTIRMRP